MPNFFVLHITIVLFAGFVAGWICKRLKASALIGYLLVGAIVGPGGFDLNIAHVFEGELDSGSIESLESDSAKNGAESDAKKSAPSPDLEAVVKSDAEVEATEFAEEVRNDRFAFEATTEFGVLLLLFAIGIEFTFDKLAATARYMFVGGALQMTLTILLSLGVCCLVGMTWKAGLMLGCVVALSSTALVYRSMQDVGQADTKRGQAALGLLVFQDIALVPLLLLLPRLFGSGAEDSSTYWFGNSWLDMTAKSSIFCGLVVLSKWLNAKYIVPRLAGLRSNELVILFSVVVLLGMCSAAQLLGLTPALGALAAGLTLGENRLTRQIDALVLPFRETFSAIFFISLGMLTDFAFVFQAPLVCFGALVGAIALKCVCATAALRVCGMDRRGAFAFGLSISQVGELAFMLLAIAYSAKAITEDAYRTILFVSVASLVATPNMVKWALTKSGISPEPVEFGKADDAIAPELLAAINSASGHAIVVGVGHIGGRLAEELSNLGKSVCLVDFNPVNLHPFAQLGFATVAGDGADPDVLRSAGIDRAEIILVTVPRDDLALNVVRGCRQANPTAVVLSRARYRLNIQPLKRAGAELVLCEENNICDALLQLLEERYIGEKRSITSGAKTV